VIQRLSTFASYLYKRVPFVPFVFLDIQIAIDCIHKFDILNYFERERFQITLTTFSKADKNFLLVSISFFSIVPRKFLLRLDSSKSGMFDSEVKAAFILASSEADEFRTLFNFEAKGLFGLLDIDKDGESGAKVAVFVCSILFLIYI
jgi:hypothetical protein